VSIYLTKPWLTLEATEVNKLQGQLGVYQIGNADSEVLFIGFAGGRSLFGLRGELGRELEQRAGQGCQFRYEVNNQYTTRYSELLMLHLHEHKTLPSENTDDVSRLGRIHPAG